MTVIASRQRRIDIDGQLNIVEDAASSRLQHQGLVAILPDDIHVVLTMIMAQCLRRTNKASWHFC